MTSSTSFSGFLSLDFCCPKQLGDTHFGEAPDFAPCQQNSLFEEFDLYNSLNKFELFEASLQTHTSPYHGLAPEDNSVNYDMKDQDHIRADSFFLDFNERNDLTAITKSCSERNFSSENLSEADQDTIEKDKARKPNAIKKDKLIVNCAHKESKYYANGMCKNCYHAKGRTKKASKCEHSDRVMYSKGVCKNCYLSTYHK